jgi:hypothetical protein
MNDRFEPRFGYASPAEKDPKKYEVSVAGRIFPMNHWRDGILHYLFGIWSGDQTFWHNPEIRFGELKLVLQVRDCRVPEKDAVFAIEGVAPDMPMNSYYGNYSLRIGNSRAEVMDALVRFAKDEHLGQVTIRFGDKTELTFFGKERRGEYGCSVYNYQN